MGPLDLSNEKISFTFQRLIQTDGTGGFYDGLGNSVAIGGGTTGATGATGPTGDTGTTGATGPTGTSGLNYERRNDFQDPYLYAGTAVVGSLENQNVWTIKRITVYSDGSTLTQSATNVAWTDRYIVIYT